MATATMTVEKIGFGTRFVAFIIDVILLGIINQIVASVFGGGDMTQVSGLTTLIGIAYVVGLWTYWGGQTVGKKAMGIKIVKADGTPFGLVPAIIRYVGYIVSGVVLLLGFFWILFDPNKQGWHDKIAGTYVVKA
ncbi:MAG: RDD family protein [Chloroflexi bacterium]|nr:RDD family protein [Chloroflexota bacterium]MBI2983314.1 RDD family protein [Chloroflexota bacterium]